MPDCENCTVVGCVGFAGVREMVKKALCPSTIAGGETVILATGRPLGVGVGVGVALGVGVGVGVGVAVGVGEAVGVGDGARTVKIAALLVTLPPALLTVHVNAAPLSARVVAGVVYEEPLEAGPPTGFPFFFHL